MGGGVGTHAAALLVHAALPKARLGTGLLEARPRREAAAIAGKQAWPDQVQAIEEQRQRFRNIMAFHKDHWPYEQKYWQDIGWM